jgi:hypothetical protein
MGSPYTYDANGNMTNDGQNTLAYDAENRMLSAANGGTSGTYSFDGNGLRVKKVSGGATTVYLFSGSKVIAEYQNGAAPSAPSTEYIYAGSSLLASVGAGMTSLPIQNPSFETYNPLNFSCGGSGLWLQPKWNSKLDFCWHHWVV